MLTTMLILLLAAEPNLERPAFFAGNQELAGYLIEGAEKNPALRAKFLEWQAALERIPQVKTLKDPMFMYTRYLRSDAQWYSVGIEQEFPWFGTLRARGDKAAEEAQAALFRFYAARNGIFAKLKTAYYDYALLDQSIKLLEAQAEILKFVEQLVHSQYSLALTPEEDLYRIQIEEEKLNDQYKSLVQSRPALSARLAEALGRESGEEIPWPQTIESAPEPPPPPVVVARIRVANPDLEAMQYMIESWKKESTLAKKMGYPMFVIGFEFGDMKSMDQDRGKMRAVSAIDSLKMLIQDGPMNGYLPTLGEIGYDLAKERYLLESESVEDELMVSAKVSLPIWRHKVRAAIAEANLMREAAENDKRSSSLMLERTARERLYEIQDGQRRITLYEQSLLPKAKQTYESLQTSYSTGMGADFIDLLSTVNMLLEFELEKARAVRDRHAACAELEMLMGGPWTTEEEPVEAQPASKEVDK